MQPGNYTLYAVATDASGVSSRVASTTPGDRCPWASQRQLRQRHDPHRTTATATGSNVGATKQSGEPNIAGNVGGKSVWYAWTAPAGGRVSVNTQGSNFDTLLGVFTGSPFRPDAGGRQRRRVGRQRPRPVALTFNATQGATYRIAVDGYNGGVGKSR